MPAGSADCCLKTAAYTCPRFPTSPHPCKPCTITSGVKRLGTCQTRKAAAGFNVTVLKGEKLEVRLLVDRPVVEVFIQGGRGAFVAASNFSVSEASVHLVNQGVAAVEANVSAWGMGCGWAAELPLPHQAK